MEKEGNVMIPVKHWETLRKLQQKNNVRFLITKPNY